MTNFFKSFTVKSHDILFMRTKDEMDEWIVLATTEVGDEIYEMFLFEHMDRDEAIAVLDNIDIKFARKIFSEFPVATDNKVGRDDGQ